MAQSHIALRALAVRQGQDIRAARCGGFFPLTPALSLGERVRVRGKGATYHLLYGTSHGNVELGESPVATDLAAFFCMFPLRTIVHLDADAFFAAVEQAADPKLRGKAIAVGGERRGIIASASYEARKFGVYTPMPTSR